MRYVGLIYAFTATLFFVTFVMAPRPKRITKQADVFLSAAFAFAWPLLCVFMIVASCSKPCLEWLDKHLDKD